MKQSQKQSLIILLWFAAIAVFAGLFASCDKTEEQPATSYESSTYDSKPKRVPVPTKPGEVLYLYKMTGSWVTNGVKNPLYRTRVEIVDGVYDSTVYLNGFKIYQIRKIK